MKTTNDTVNTNETATNDAMSAYKSELARYGVASVVATVVDIGAGVAVTKVATANGVDRKTAIGAGLLTYAAGCIAFNKLTEGWANRIKWMQFEANQENIKNAFETMSNTMDEIWEKEDRS